MSDQVSKEPLEYKPPTERFEAVLAAWVEQLRADHEIIRAVAYGRQVDVTLYAHKCRAAKTPDHMVKGLEVRR